MMQSNFGRKKKRNVPCCRPDFDKLDISLTAPCLWAHVGSGVRGGRSTPGVDSLCTTTQHTLDSLHSRPASGKPNDSGKRYHRGVVQYTKQNLQGPISQQRFGKKGERTLAHFSKQDSPRFPDHCFLETSPTSLSGNVSRTGSCMSHMEEMAGRGWSCDLIRPGLQKAPITVPTKVLLNSIFLTLALQHTSAFQTQN